MRPCRHCRADGSRLGRIVSVGSHCPMKTNGQTLSIPRREPESVGDGSSMGFAPKIRFAVDSPLEGTGFEPSVPRQEKWSMPSSSDQTRVGRTLTLREGAESSLEGRDIELSVSPRAIAE